MRTFKSLATRLTSSAVAWSWAFNGMRLAAGLILLPLLLRKLSKPEFGMYYVFLSVTGLLPFLDFGFSGTIGRFVSYAMAGAKTIQPQGFVPSSSENKEPNFSLLWSLLRTTRKLYLVIALIGLGIMGVWGTVLVAGSVDQTPFPRITWIAWLLTLIATSFELYSLWWNSFLFSINRVHQSARIGFTAYTLRLLLACAFLLFGLGLISVPAAALVGSLTNRFFSRRTVLKVLGKEIMAPGEKNLLPILWPNSWRLGVQTLSVYLRTNAFTQICVFLFGLSVTAEYGLTLQILNIASGMSMVWTSVKWPQIGQLRSRQDTAAMRRVLWPRFWLLLTTFTVLSTAATIAGPTLLELLRTDKRLLPASLMALAAVYSLLDLHFIFWSTLLAIENRIPTLWSTVATNVFALGLGLLVSSTFMDLRGLIVAPLIAGLAFIYWYWPRVGARSLNTTWTRFIFTKPG